MMQKETIEKYIRQLDGMIAAFSQAAVIGGRTRKETQASTLLQKARLRLVEDLEERGEPGWALPRQW